MHSLINAKNVRERALKYAAEDRPAAGFNRVSDNFLTKAEAQLRIWIKGSIQRMPSVGKTIK